MALIEIPEFDASRNYVVSGGTLNLIRRMIIERTPLAGPGVLIRETPKGIELHAGGPSEPVYRGHPFQISAGSASGKWIIEPGISGGMQPTIGGVTLDTEPAPEFTAGSATNLVIKMVIAPRATDTAPDMGGNWVCSGIDEIVSAVIESHSSLPSDDPAEVNISSGAPSNGTYYFGIGSVNGDTTVTGQWLRTSFGVSGCGYEQTLGVTSYIA